MIKRIRIQCFRSLRDVTVDFSPLTVLIGRSGTGKSNFVNAIRYLRAAVQVPGSSEDYSRLAKRTGDAVNWFIAFDQKPESRLSVEIAFEVPTISGIFLYELDRKVSGKVDYEGLELDTRPLFAWEHDTRDRKWLVPPKEHAPPVLDGHPMIGRLPGIRECQIAFLYLSRGIGCYDFPSNLFDASAQPGIIQGGMSDDGANALAVANNLSYDINGLRRFDEIQATLRALNPSVATITTTDAGSKLIVGHTLPGGQILTLPIQQESEGFRRVFAHLLAVYQQPERQAMIFEEPEKGIHPGALSLLADTFRAVAESGRAQIILVTHSPALLSHFSVDEIRVVEMKDGETQIGPVSPEQQASLEKHLLTSDELLTVDYARIENAATISTP